MHHYFLFRGALRVTANEPNSLPTSSTTTSAASESASSESPKRNSSRKSLMSSFRDIEKPGAGIGLVEPVDSTNLGVYPVYVTATKKTLVLSITQRAIVETMDGFRQDVPLLRQGLLKEHKSIIDSLRIPEAEAPGSPSAMVEATMQLEIGKGKVDITDDSKDRVAALETRVQDTLKTMSKIHADIAALPQILQLLEKAAGTDSMSVLTSERTK